MLLTSLDPIFPGDNTYYILPGNNNSLNFSDTSKALYGMCKSPMIKANYQKINMKTL